MKSLKRRLAGSPGSAINVTGPYLVADEAKKIWQAQGLNGSLVITTSANATVAKQGSFAYDTSKATANHLVRELANRPFAAGARQWPYASDGSGREQHVPARPCDQLSCQIPDQVR